MIDLGELSDTELRIGNWALGIGHWALGIVHWALDKQGNSIFDFGLTILD
ncbi:hypothetical protein [Nostoc sp.]